MFKPMINSLNLPEPLIRNVIGAHAEIGERWLAEFPALLLTLCRAWNLRDVSAFPNLSYNYVASAIRNDQEPVVLKLGVPVRELLTEAEALRLYDGKGAVRLLASRPADGAMLLERVEPGRPLTTLADDEEATSIATSVMKKLWNPLPAEHQLPSLRQWGRSLLSLSVETSPLPAVLLDRAKKLLLELLDSSPDAVLLHGDLHHDNILTAERAPWLAIDPKGLTGDPAYEVGTFLLNPAHVMKRFDLAKITARRIDQLTSELGFERSRILGWGFVQAMLSACWCLEDRSDEWRSGVACAEILQTL